MYSFDCVATMCKFCDIPPDRVVVFLSLACVLIAKKQRKKEMSTPINLNVSPARWKINIDRHDAFDNLVTHYSPQIKYLLATHPELSLNGVLSKLHWSVRKVIVALLTKAMQSALNGHIVKQCTYIAEILDVTVLDVLFLNVTYDLTSLCTSVVIEDAESGYPMHARTMDWEIKELRDLTVDVDIESHGHVVSRITTWAGMVGAFTGMAGGFSISVNFRPLNDLRQVMAELKTHKSFRAADKGISWTNRMLGFGPSGLRDTLVAHLNDRGADAVLLTLWRLYHQETYTVAHLVLKTLTEEKTYEDAVQRLCNTPIISPVYFTIAGSRPGEGIIIARNPESRHIKGRCGARHKMRLGDSKNRVLVQPNMDWWDQMAPDILHSKARKKFIRKHADSARSPSGLWRLMQRYPVQNKITLYTVLMLPKDHVYASCISGRCTERYETHISKKLPRRKNMLPAYATKNLHKVIHGRYDFGVGESDYENEPDSENESESENGIQLHY